MKNISGNEFPKLLSESKNPVICVFSASWCGPCKMFAPTLEHVSKQLANQYTFAKIDIDECESLCNAQRIASVPTIILFKGSAETKRKSGAFPTPESFTTWITDK